METVLRCLAVYVFLTVVFRVAGKRPLSEATTFDLILLLIISEAVSQSIQGNDFSLTNGFIATATLVGLEILMSLLKSRSKRIERWLEGVPVVIVDEGKLLRERMRKLRVDEDDIMEAARESHGLERMEQVKYAVVERGGSIAIIPREA
jgi:uncharacterized membrane protein YcaP (DUF421 family)